MMFHVKPLPQLVWRTKRPHTSHLLENPASSIAAASFDEAYADG